MQQMNEHANRSVRAWETAVAAQRRAELAELEANWRESVRTAAVREHEAQQDKRRR